MSDLSKVGVFAKDKGRDRSAYALRPRRSLGSEIFAAFIRDTRTLDLNPRQRFNFYPAFPFCVFNWISEGEAYEVAGCDAELDLSALHPLPKLYFCGPRTKPLVIWNPDKAVILSVGFFPQAIATLTRNDVAQLVDVTAPASAIVGNELAALCASVAQASDPEAAFALLQDELAQRANVSPPIPLPGATDRVRVWEPAIALEAAGPPGTRSKRQTERRIKQWTGHARRGLAMYLRAEQFFELALQLGPQEPPWSGVAHDLGFSDQSHMIRDTKRLTGFTPRALHRRLDEEPFWCYRVLGDLLTENGGYTV